mgnify:CR=1 FL=1
MLWAKASLPPPRSPSPTRRRPRPRPRMPPPTTEVRQYATVPLALGACRRLCVRSGTAVGPGTHRERLLRAGQRRGRQACRLVVAGWAALGRRRGEPLARGGGVHSPGSPLRRLPFERACAHVVGRKSTVLDTAGVHLRRWRERPDRLGGAARTGHEARVWQRTAAAAVHRRDGVPVDVRGGSPATRVQGRRPAALRAGRMAAPVRSRSPRRGARSSKPAARPVRRARDG